MVVVSMVVLMVLVLVDVGVGVGVGVGGVDGDLCLPARSGLAAF